MLHFYFYCFTACFYCADFHFTKVHIHHVFTAYYVNCEVIIQTLKLGSVTDLTCKFRVDTASHKKLLM